jgi:hypothetical protein
MKRLTILIMTLICLTGAVADPRYIPQIYAAVDVSQASVGVLYYSETGQYLHGTFRRYYEENGGTAIFGLPLTPIISDGGLRVQYFERARFEVPVGHDATNEVLLTRIGAHFVDQLSAEDRALPPFARIKDPGADSLYFAQTGHSISNSFRDFWQTNGGLRVFGYPLSEDFFQDINGEAVRVQYFERVRLETHVAHNQVTVMIGNLGKALLYESPSLAPYTTPLPGLQRVAISTTSYKGAGVAKQTNIARAGAMIDGTIVPAGAEFSFLKSSNFVDTDFVEGYGIINGKLAKIIGGGLCQVSTTVFRAASNGGFDITMRVPHTYVVTTYEDILGFDATVLEPTVDFRFVNDSANLLLLVVHNDPANMRFTVEFWGVPDGRTVQYDGPLISNVTKPGVPIWQYDPNMKHGATRQLVIGRGGMKVSYVRTVNRADGSELHKDNFLTSYAPWYNYVVYGPGVVPPAGVRLR